MEENKENEDLEDHKCEEKSEKHINKVWKSATKETILSKDGVECPSELIFVSSLRFIKEKAFQEFGTN